MVAQCGFVVGETVIGAESVVAVAVDEEEDGCVGCTVEDDGFAVVFSGCLV